MGVKVFEGLKYVGIKVEGIRDYRHVCKKSESYQGKPIIEAGVAYVRSHGKDGNVTRKDEKTGRTD